ncbi:MAG: protoporphyrinogen oxidase [Desulfobulbus sp.]|nr:protoporphyrinogen oxidase [Desulfobulbus sp.]
MNASHLDVCIVGAGLSGLSTAAFLRHQYPELRLLILEQEDRAGGAMASFSDQGFQAEWGPHGFLDNCAESRELINLAGLRSEVTIAPLSDFVRYLCLDGRLQCIPQSPLKILRAPLVSWGAKLRVLAELWQEPLDNEPSVAQWVAHRFGPALVPFADAVFTGTYAGDIEQLKIDAVMPGVRELEKHHGSVIRGLVAKVRSGKKGGKTKKKALPAMTSFTQGMTMLPDRLAADLDAEGILRTSCTVTALEQLESGWRVLTDGEAIECRHLVLALPVNRSLSLITSALPSQPPPQTVIPETRILSVLLGFDARAQIPFGFGYLAPEKEQRFALGALFSSHMFPGRAPQGCQLLEALVGGRRHPDRLELSDEALIEQVYQDLSKLMDLPAPIYTKVLRPNAAIPQLEDGYTRLLAWREDLHRRHPNLHLCGFGWQGIGINDMVKEARKMADRVSSVQRAAEGPEVKGVYF